MSYIQDEFNQFSEDEKLLMLVERQPTRGIYTIDVGNATQEVAEEAVRRLKEKIRNKWGNK